MAGGTRSDRTPWSSGTSGFRAGGAGRRRIRSEGAVVFNRSVAPVDPAGLGDYLHRAEVLLAQLERHGAYLHLRAWRDMDDRADADADDRIADAVDLLTERAEAALRTLGGAAFARQLLRIRR